MVITDHQKRLVLEASEVLMQNVDELGVLYFTKIFENGPSLKDRFSFLRKEKEEMKKEKEAMKKEAESMKDELKKEAAAFKKEFKQDFFRETGSFRKGKRPQSYDDPKDAASHPKLKKHAAEVFKMVLEGVVQIAETGKLELDPSKANLMTSVHNKNGVKETDFPVYATSLGPAAQQALKEKYTEDTGKALEEAHNKLIENMKKHSEHQKLVADMKQKINELKEASHSNQRGE